MIKGEKDVEYFTRCAISCCYGNPSNFRRWLRGTVPKSPGTKPGLLPLSNCALCTVNRNAQNAMSPLRRTGAATTWSVGTRTAKLSSAGCVWAPGSLMGLPGEFGSGPCGEVRKPREKERLFELKSGICVPVTGTTAIVTTRMMQRQQGMHRR